MRIVPVIAKSHESKALILAVQVNNPPAQNKNDQLRTAERHLGLLQPFAGKVELACFPELSTVGFSEPAPAGEMVLRNYNLLCETTDGAVCSLFRDAARQLRLWIGFGLPRQEGQQLFSSQVFAGPNGEMQVSDKRRETDPFTPGRNNLTLVINGLRIHVVICCDIHAEETDTQVKLERPDLVLTPSYTSTGTGLGFFAIKWRTNVLCVNLANKEPAPRSNMRAGLSTFYLYGADRAVSLHSLAETEEGAILAQL